MHERVNYLDDFLIVADSQETCLEGQLFLHKTLSMLGFYVSYRQVRSPNQVQRYLGIEVYSFAPYTSLSGSTCILPLTCAMAQLVRLTLSRRCISNGLTMLIKISVRSHVRGETLSMKELFDHEKNLPSIKFLGGDDLSAKRLKAALKKPQFQSLNMQGCFGYGYGTGMFGARSGVYGGPFTPGSRGRGRGFQAN